MSHHCQALVLHCIDFRFHRAIADFLERELDLRGYDIVAVPGAAKHLTTAGSAMRRDGIVEDIDISIRLHNPSHLILINHADCGAYGGVRAFPSRDAEREHHRAALEEAAAFLAARYPERTIRRYFVEYENETPSLVEL